MAATRLIRMGGQTDGVILKCQPRFSQGKGAGVGLKVGKRLCIALVNSARGFCFPFILSAL